MRLTETSLGTEVVEAVDDNLTAVSPLQDGPQEVSGSFFPRFIRNSAANVARLIVTALVAILLPAYLTHHLPVATYGAWVLILQLGAYVSYLDFGVQTAISKYIAEFEARGDVEGCGRSASTGLMIMLGASVVGIILTLILAWRVPELFRNMPIALQSDVRISILFVGTSLAISLAAGVFSAIFLGLQRYHIPMVATIATRLLYAAVICIAVKMHSGLIVMGACVAAVNIAGAALQIGLWKKFAGHIRMTLFKMDVPMFRQMLAYCGILTIWSACMLCISGIDITVVGHFAFSDVAFYSIATSPTTLILTVIGAVMGPLLPAASALSVKRSSEEMGVLLLRATRYSAIILWTTGLPIMVGGFLLLRLWVGPVYALHSVRFLRLLLLANIIRNFCGPYATMVVALSKQRVATAAAVTEGVVNLVSSIWLATRYGAMGVAAGTLIGAVATVAMHFIVSMRYTHESFAVSRTKLFFSGIVRATVPALPSILLLPFWWRIGPPALSLPVWIAWGASTILLAWYVGLTVEDRLFVAAFLRRSPKTVPGP